MTHTDTDRSTDHDSPWKIVCVFQTKVATDSMAKLPPRQAA